MEKPVELQLRKVSGRSPLAGRLNRILGSPEIRRARQLASLLQGFHLKNTVTEKVSGRQAVIDGESVVNFGSANYLGLDQHPAVLEAAHGALNEWGHHSGCSRIFSSHAPILELEGKLAELVGAEAAIVYPNTSSAHIGVIPTLFSLTLEEPVTLFLDRYAHTSMHQAALMAVAKGAKLVRVDIRDLAKTEELIQNSGRSIKALLIDGVYSMQGTVPDLPALQEICRRTETILYVDDAHGIAIFGETGGGVVEECGLKYENLILVGGLQKGLGSYGGFVAGSQTLIELLKVSSRSYIFSGTLQPHAVSGGLAAIRVCRSAEGQALRHRLKGLSKRVRKELQAMQFEVMDGDSPIVSVLIGPELRTLLAGRKLFDHGVYVNSVLYPATPRGEGLLRISLNAIHTDEEIATLMRAFSELRIYLDTFREPFGPNLKYAREFASRQINRRWRRLATWVKTVGV